MEYAVLTEKDQGDLMRRHLLQAEADHFTHKLNAVKARAAGDENAATQYEELASKAESDVQTIKDYATNTQPNLAVSVEPAVPQAAEVPANAVAEEEAAPTPPVENTAKAEK